MGKEKSKKSEENVDILLELARAAPFYDTPTDNDILASITRLESERLERERIGSSQVRVLDGTSGNVHGTTLPAFDLTEEENQHFQELLSVVVSLPSKRPFERQSGVYAGFRVRTIEGYVDVNKGWVHFIEESGRPFKKDEGRTIEAFLLKSALQRGHEEKLLKMQVDKAFRSFRKLLSDFC